MRLAASEWSASNRTDGHNRDVPVGSKRGRHELQKTSKYKRVGYMRKKHKWVAKIMLAGCEHSSPVLQ